MYISGVFRHRATNIWSDLYLARVPVLSWTGVACCAIQDAKNIKICNFMPGFGTDNSLHFLDRSRMPWQHYLCHCIKTLHFILISFSEKKKIEILRQMLKVFNYFSNCLSTKKNILKVYLMICLQNRLFSHTHQDKSVNQK